MVYFALPCGSRILSFFDIPQRHRRHTGLAQGVFNTGMPHFSPVRYLFLGLLVLRLRAFGASRAFACASLAIGALVVAGSVGMFAVTFSLNLALRKS